MKIYQRLCLGDQIACNGLIRVLFGHREFSVFAKPNDACSVEFMFRDLHCNVIPAFDEEARAQLTSSDVILGLGNSPRFGESFQKHCYKQKGVSFSHKCNSFSVERIEQRELSLYQKVMEENDLHNKKYIFVHDHPSRAYSKKEIKSSLPQVHPQEGLTDNIFDYLLLLGMADEIHCIDSSFRSLVDCALPKLAVPKFRIK